MRLTQCVLRKRFTSPTLPVGAVSHRRPARQRVSCAGRRNGTQGLATLSLAPVPWGGRNTTSLARSFLPPLSLSNWRTRKFPSPTTFTTPSSMASIWAEICENAAWSNRAARAFGMVASSGEASLTRLTSSLTFMLLLPLRDLEKTHFRFHLHGDRPHPDTTIMGQPDPLVLITATTPLVFCLPKPPLSEPPCAGIYSTTSLVGSRRAIHPSQSAPLQFFLPWIAARCDSDRRLETITNASFTIASQPLPSRRAPHPYDILSPPPN